MMFPISYLVYSGNYLECLLITTKTNQIGKKHGSLGFMAYYTLLLLNAQQINGLTTIKSGCVIASYRRVSGTEESPCQREVTRHEAETVVCLYACVSRVFFEVSAALGTGGNLH